MPKVALSVVKYIYTQRNRFGSYRMSSQIRSVEKEDWDFFMPNILSWRAKSNSQG